MRAGNQRPIVDEKGRRKNAAARARRLAENKADSMPAVAPLDGPKAERVVAGELISPSPRGGVVEVFQQRYLLGLIVRRELAQMYAASLLGLAWSYIQPAIRFAVYYLVFAFILGAHLDTPYFALHLFTGMVFVHYFAETWGGGTRSIWANRALVLKMRMPREIFPVASMVVAMYHTFPQVLVLIVCCLISGWSITWASVGALVLGLALLVTFALAMGLFFAAINVFARDVQNIVATIQQFIHFMVPMMYSFSLVYEQREDHPIIYQLYIANPLAEAVMLIQKFFWWTLLSPEQQAANPHEFAPDLYTRGFIMLAISIAMLYFAQKFFAKVEGKFPERL